MSRFSELMKKTLPSKVNEDQGVNSFFESTDVTEEELTKVDDIHVDDIEKASEPETGDETESERIDETIKRVATPIIVQDVLDEDEVAIIKESTDGDIAIDEGYMTERSIVRLDKPAKKTQLIKICVLAIAKEKKDPLYKKLHTVWKLERSLEAKLFEKYGNQAKQRAQKYIQNAKKSKSATVKKAANKLSK